MESGSLGHTGKGGLKEGENRQALKRTEQRWRRRGRAQDKHTGKLIRYSVVTSTRIHYQCVDGISKIVWEQFNL